MFAGIFQTENPFMGYYLMQVVSLTDLKLEIHMISVFT